MSMGIEIPAGARIIIDGKAMDYFAGSGYLDLQNHPDVIKASVDALNQYGFSTATSRGGYGEHRLYKELEQEACAYFDAEKVLYFASGYLGPSILTQATRNRFDHIFIDSSAHFSLWDAAFGTNLPITPFQHGNAQSLAEHLHNELLSHERPLVLSDGVFPVSGEIAPLPDYLELVKPLRGLVYLDDAHAVGVLGENGRGTPEFFHIQDTDCSTSATLAKALGGFGGIIWGRKSWIERIDHVSSIYAGASPLPLVVTAASARALAIARMTPKLRDDLWENVKQARNGLRSLGWDLPDSPIPIICLGSRTGINLGLIKKNLFKQAIAVELVRSYPSSPAGGALRIAIFATHSQEQIERLINEIGRFV